MADYLAGYPDALFNGTRLLSIGLPYRNVIQKP